MSASCQYLLSVDIGLHTGLALFSSNQELLWYRSHHLSTPAKLKKLIASLLRQTPRPNYIYLEGGGQLVDIWKKEAEKLSIPTRQLHADQWRRTLFYRRQHSNRSQAKKEAEITARKVINALGGKKPTSLRHDTAEAILIGLFALLELGWVHEWPGQELSLHS